MAVTAAGSGSSPESQASSQGSASDRGVAGMPAQAAARPGGPAIRTQTRSVWSVPPLGVLTTCGSGIWRGLGDRVEGAARPLRGCPRMAWYTASARPMSLIASTVSSRDANRASSAS